MRSSSSVSIKAWRTSGIGSWRPISHATVLLPTPAAPQITRTFTAERILLSTDCPNDPPEWTSLSRDLTATRDRLNHAEVSGDKNPPQLARHSDSLES